jgi:hypothetical protein
VPAVCGARVEYLRAPRNATTPVEVEPIAGAFVAPPTARPPGSVSTGGGCLPLLTPPVLGHLARARDTLLAENNVRKGFMEEAAFQAVRSHLPEHLRAMADVAFDRLAPGRTALPSLTSRRSRGGVATAGATQDEEQGAAHVPRHPRSPGSAGRAATSQAGGRASYRADRGALFLFYTGPKAGEPVKTFRRACPCKGGGRAGTAVPRPPPLGSAKS